MIFKKKKPTPSVPRLTWMDKFKLLRLTQDDTMMTKLKSRKLWVTVLTAALLTLSQQLGLDPELTTKLVALAASYVLGQSIVDAKA
jgi:hypothetical protein